jgi:HSP20 family protein
MRYRRLSYRYAVVMATSQPRSFGDAWHRQPAGFGMGPSFWRPPTDVVETASEVIVLVELAGIDHDQLDVLLFEDALIVEGERRLPAYAAGVYHAAEIRQGQVRLELPLPAPIDPEQVDARYERGLLEMRLVKRSAGGRAVSIPISQVVDATAATLPPTRSGSVGPARLAGDRERDDDASE